MIYEKKLSVVQFKKFQRLIYDEIGIHLSDHKRTLVQARLRRWLVEFSFESYEDLYERITEDKSEQMLMMLVNAMTTNVTSFFREEHQWVYLSEHIGELFDPKKRRIRIWSSACSSGQEPYSIIMYLKEHLKEFHRWDIKILATDISEEILRQATRGVYKKKELETMPERMLERYFTPVITEDKSNGFAIKSELRQYVTFRTFNLVTGDYRMFKNRFDLIFCRNVMIYFDRLTQKDLLGHLSGLLGKQSRLLLGHSESIQQDSSYEMVYPSIYRLS